MLRKAANASTPLPRAMVGFDNVRRYRDTAGHVVAKLLPGDYYVTREDEVLDTVLGSCVSACIRNPKTNVGGMNHFMLPHPRVGDKTDSWHAVAGTATRYGSASMEKLINKVLGAGGLRSDLEVKIFGGACVLAAITDVGEHNVQFVREFLKQEGLKVASEDVGNTTPRHIQYFPRSGRVRVKHLNGTLTATVLSQEVKYSKVIDKQPDTGSIDLF